MDRTLVVSESGLALKAALACCCTQPSRRRTQGRRSTAPRATNKAWNGNAPRSHCRESVIAGQAQTVLRKGTIDRNSALDFRAGRQGPSLLFLTPTWNLLVLPLEVPQKHHEVFVVLPNGRAAWVRLDRACRAPWLLRRRRRRRWRGHELPSGSRLQAVDEVRRALRVAGRGEDRIAP